MFEGLEIRQPIGLTLLPHGFPPQGSPFFFLVPGPLQLNLNTDNRGVEEKKQKQCELL